jgi:predicted DNA-binding protein (MmcQ/YjbR family)
MFTVFGGDDKHPATVIFKTDPEEHRALATDDRFFGPAYFDRDHWLALDLTAAEVDWDEVAELLDTSYRLVALKRMLAALDA